MLVGYCVAVGAGVCVGSGSGAVRAVKARDVGGKDSNDENCNAVKYGTQENPSKDGPHSPLSAPTIRGPAVCDMRMQRFDSVRFRKGCVYTQVAEPRVKVPQAAVCVHPEAGCKIASLWGQIGFYQLVSPLRQLLDNLLAFFMMLGYAQRFFYLGLVIFRLWNTQLLFPL